MKRPDLEHLIRAVGGVVRDHAVIVFGSQSILGSFPQAPKELLISKEADIYPRNRTQGVSLIDGAVGEDSVFHATFGYFAHGVTPEIATLPDGWEERLMPIATAATGGVIGWCLEPHDLAISKLAAGREKDHNYVRAMLKHRLVNVAVLRQRLNQTPLKPAGKKSLQAEIVRLNKEGEASQPAIVKKRSLRSRKED